MLKPWRVFASVAAVVLLAESSAAAPFNGQSADYGFVFGADNEENWCQPVVKVGLRVTERAKFNGDPYGLEKRLNRLMMIARDQCDQMLRLEVRAWDGHDLVYNIEYARNTDWTFIRKTLDTDVAQCPPGGSAADCRRLVVGFELIKAKTSDTYFRDMLLTDFLTGIRSTAEWRQGSVVGRLNVFDLNEYQEDPQVIANSIVGALSDDCTRSGGQLQELSELPSRGYAAYSGVECTKGTDVAAHNIVVVRQGDFGWLFAIGTDAGNPREARAWAEKFFAAF